MVWHSNHAPGVNQLLARLIGANMNITTDQPMTWVAGTTPNATNFRYVVERILVNNASLSLTTAAGGIYDTASKAGVIIVAAAQAYATLTAATVGMDLTIAGTGRVMLAAVPIFSLTTGQGAAATADIYMFGRYLPPPNA